MRLPALVLALLAVATPAATASSGDFSPMGAAYGFATDGVRYAAWIDPATDERVLLDTRTGERRRSAGGVCWDLPRPHEDFFAPVSLACAGAPAPADRPPCPRVAAASRPSRLGLTDAVAPEALARFHGRITLQRCTGGPVDLGPDELMTGSAQLGGGWLTWDDAPEITVFEIGDPQGRGVLHAARVRSGHVRRLRLPKPRVDLCGTPVRMPFGWSAHTATHVFFLAEVTAVYDKYCVDVGPERLFVAPLRRDAVDLVPEPPS